MALISLRQLLDYAAEHQFAVPAFNASNMEQVHAIMQAANAVDSPVIIQGSGHVIMPESLFCATLF
jgi:fructose-bisphosphate aldolase class II